MDDYADDMRLKNTLSHEVHVAQTSRSVTKLRALSTCSQVVQLARVSVRVLVVDVVCVMLVLIARVVVHACCKYSFRCQFSVVGDVLFTKTPTLTRYHPSSKRISRRPSWIIRRVSTTDQSKKSLHINSLYRDQRYPHQNCFEKCLGKLVMSLFNKQTYVVYYK